MFRVILEEDWTPKGDETEVQKLQPYPDATAQRHGPPQVTGPLILLTIAL